MNQLNELRLCRNSIQVLQNRLFVYDSYYLWFQIVKKNFVVWQCRIEFEYMAVFKKNKCFIVFNLKNHISDLIPSQAFGLPLKGIK